MNTTVRIVIVAAAVALAALLGFQFGQRRVEVDAETAPASAAVGGEREVLYWYDPMAPEQRFDKPGKSPFMDMMLVPRYADEVQAGGVRIDPGVQQNLGIRTAVVEVGSLAQPLRVPGTLQWNLRHEQRVSARVEGLVERLHVRAPFDRVRRGDPLATVLAPMLGSALAEYHALAAAESAQARSLKDAARARLRVLGLTPGDVQGSASSAVPRIVLRAPFDAVVTEIGIREGDTVAAGQTLFRLNATDTLWLEARLPQAVASSIAAGSAVDVHVDAVPDVVFAGTVESLLPEVDAATRTQIARIVLDNAQGRLAAGQFAEVGLAGNAGATGPLLPNEALILTGRDARVIVLRDDGRFEPRRVRTGRQVGERIEILEGLVGGEHVVVSGQFLIDSEASLSGVLSRLPAPVAEEAPKAPEAHHHGEQP